MSRHPPPAPNRNVISDQNLAILRLEQGSEAVSPVLNGWRSILNPFNELSEERPHTLPLCLNIPNHFHSLETVIFLGFNVTKATLIYNAQRDPGNHNYGHDLLWFVLRYVSEVEKLAVHQRGITDPKIILMLAGWYWGNVKLEHIDTGWDQEPSHIPSTVVHEFIYRIAERISRRYDFLSKLDRLLAAGSEALMEWSENAHPSTIGYYLSDLANEGNILIDYDDTLPEEKVVCNGAS